MFKVPLIPKLNNFVAKHYGDNPGKMLVHTGVIGWILSAAAQVLAISINDKIPREQKMFLLPQEIADAAVNIASFYIITQSCKSIGNQLVITGKLLPSSIRQALQKQGLKDIGKAGFSVPKQAKLSKTLQKHYDLFNNGVDVISTTLGSILSCNIVTPIIRNDIAAVRQKKGIAQMQLKQQQYKSKAHVGIKTPASLTSFQTFQACASSRMNSGALKI